MNRARTIAYGIPEHTFLVSSDRVSILGNYPTVVKAANRLRIKASEKSTVALTFLGVVSTILIRDLRKLQR